MSRGKSLEPRSPGSQTLGLCPGNPHAGDQLPKPEHLGGLHPLAPLPTRLPCLARRIQLPCLLRAAGVGREERLKLYPLSAWGQESRPPRFLHHQNPRRIFLKFSFHIIWLNIWNFLNGNCRKNEKYFRLGTQYLPGREPQEKA